MAHTMKSIIGILLAIFAGESFACYCARISGEDASYIVLGKVERIDYINRDADLPMKLAHFSEVAFWKGKHRKQFLVEHYSRTSCGVPFQEGEEYLLFLPKPKKKNYFFAYICNLEPYTENGMNELDQIFKTTSSSGSSKNE